MKSGITKWFSIIMIIIIIGGICFFDLLGAFGFFYNNLNLSYTAAIILASILVFIIAFILFYLAWEKIRMRIEHNKRISNSKKSLSRSKSKSIHKSSRKSKRSRSRKKALSSKQP